MDETLLLVAGALLVLFLMGKRGGTYKSITVSGQQVPGDITLPGHTPPIPHTPGSFAIPGVGRDALGNIIWVLDPTNLGPHTVPWDQVPAAWKQQFAQWVH
jgi:hypothetical protein